MNVILLEPGVKLDDCLIDHLHTAPEDNALEQAKSLFAASAPMSHFDVIGVTDISFDESATYKCSTVGSADFVTEAFERLGVDYRLCEPGQHPGGKCWRVRAACYRIELAPVDDE